MTTAPARPPQVTFAGWLTIGASVVAVVMAFAEVARVGSLETQEAITRFLAEDPARSFGLSVADVQEMLRLACTTAAACAAVTGVLGWFVLQRSRGSRLALSLVAAPLLLAGLFSGGFAAAIVAASATMLWLQPARAWFAGDAAPSAPPTGAPAPRDPVARRPGWLPVPPTSATDTPEVPAWSSAPPPAAAQRPVLLGEPAAPAADRRPGALVWACALTWVCTAVVVLLLVATAVLVAESDGLLDEAYRQNPDLAGQGVSLAAVRASIYVFGALGVLWSLGAAVVAVLAFRRVRWAMVALLASSLLAGGLCLLLALGSLVTLVIVVACGVTIALLLRPGVRQWYAVR